MCGSDIFLGLLAVIFPPLPVWVKRGLCSADSLINIALCVLGFLPGLIHSWYIIASYPDPTYEELAQHDAEHGRVTYYYIQQGQAQPANGQQRGYGTVQPAQAPGGQYQNQQDAMIQGQAGSSSQQNAEAPPPYQESIQGDNKVQRHN
ncbi:putative stress response RCI peptide [Myriangium duriaei CBS 260.36]|uniref:Stress response RCI peptide n=1 Tax=Myriangium duriaei CBS 260.36 TaxID=1168546 RepID=A0A9P4J122_9PEZI|nr:putative stress response RCI peptide [Myriangium duriaei CBS 260.36]